MPTLYFVDREGVEHAIEGKNGRSVMETVRDAGIDDLLALCGGCMSCATCHVYVDPAFEDRLSAMSEDEKELLDGASGRRPESRLACQLPIEGLDGLRVTIAAD